MGNSYESSEDPDSTSASRANRSDADASGSGSRRKRRSKNRIRSANDSAGSPSDSNSNRSSVGEATLSPENPDASRSSKETANAPLANADAKLEPSRYEAMGELGRGGWGVVERAMDVQLQREVAVKRITGTATVSEEARQRFLHEAKVTSQLQHPGIVPVHELSEGIAADKKRSGRSSTGPSDETFYVMKLLEGDTLRNELRQVHLRLRKNGSSFSTIELQDAILPLLDRFIDICHAVGYAHSRGILHRDLKPANVMIGQFGETIVVDWGLAKHVDVADEFQSQLSGIVPDANQKDVRDVDAMEDDLESASRLASSKASQCASSSAAGSGARSLTPNQPLTPNQRSLPTSHGTIFGTPAYMSPEQASGEVENLQSSSDLYSLGVMLHEILTGQHPFNGLGIEEVLDRVRNSRFESAKQSLPAVPRALSAICEHSMQSNPADRYQSAEAIAEDVRNYIAGEAVSVDHETWLDRATRWIRRHRTIATTAFAVIIVAMISAAGIALVIQQAHLVERAAHQQTQLAQAEAMTRLTQTRETADAWFIDLSGALQFYPGLQPIREKLISDAIDLYESLLLATDRDAELNAANGYDSNDPLRQMQSRLHHQRILERIQCDCRLGDLYRLSNDSMQATTHYDTACRDAIELESLHKKLHGDDHGFHEKIQIEIINSRIGRLLSLAEGQSISDTVAAQTKQDAEKLEAWLRGNRDLSDSANWARHASCLSRLLFAWERANDSSKRFALASERLRESERWAEQLFECRGSDADARWVETVKVQRATRLLRDGQHDESRRVWESLVEHLSELCRQHPQRVDFRQSLANARLQLGRCMQQAPGAEYNLSDHFQGAIADIHRSIQLTDSDDFCAANLARAHLGLGLSLSKDPECRAESENQLRRSIQITQQMLQSKITAGTLREFCQAHLALLTLQPPLELAEQTKSLDAAELSIELLFDHGLASAEDARHLKKLQAIRQQSLQVPSPSTAGDRQDVPKQDISGTMGLGETI